MRNAFFICRVGFFDLSIDDIAQIVVSTSCIKFPGGRLQGAQMPRPWDRESEQMPWGEGGRTQVGLTDALSPDPWGEGGTPIYMYKLYRYVPL